MLQRYFCREYAVRAFLCITGIVIMTVAVGFIRYADFGIDPVMSLVNGLCLTVFAPIGGLSFGTVYLLFSFVLLISVFIFDRSVLGLGTLAVMTLNGYISDFVLLLLNLVHFEETGFFIFRILLLVAGILLMCLGYGF
jgi:uncharacterized membrane protein YczE